MSRSGGVDETFEQPGDLAENQEVSTQELVSNGPGDEENQTALANQPKLAWADVARVGLPETQTKTEPAPQHKPQTSVDARPVEVVRRHHVYPLSRADVTAVSFPNPNGFSFMTPEEELLYKKQLIVFQVEYYFSVENLCRDMYLRKQMDRNGWVPLKVLAAFKRIEALTSRLDILKSALKHSVVVEVRSDRLRRAVDWALWVLPETLNAPSETPTIDSATAETTTPAPSQLSKQDPSPEPTAPRTSTTTTPNPPNKQTPKPPQPTEQKRRRKDKPAPTPPVQKSQPVPPPQTKDQEIDAKSEAVPQANHPSQEPNPTAEPPSTKQDPPPDNPADEPAQEETSEVSKVTHSRAEGLKLFTPRPTLLANPKSIPRKKIKQAAKQAAGTLSVADRLKQKIDASLQSPVKIRVPILPPSSAAKPKTSPRTSKANSTDSNSNETALNFHPKTTIHACSRVSAAVLLLIGIGLLGVGIYRALGL
eukprot:c13648_g1_i1.p1 GENE.c13648_g1_i1~~c13648_g1_i1.p1  ORF type:complete len:487 (-),score=93.41 c13648_g1_i1:1252-2688(-)